HISTRFPKIWADENRFIQILFNLVHNAIKHTTSGSITIKSEVLGNQAMIYVEDTGSGIDASEMEDIFNPYIQGQHHQHMDTGIGIGLSVSKQLVELHGGEITFQSSKKGTTFMFTMPLGTSKQISEKNPAAYSAEMVQEIDEPPVAADKELVQHADFSNTILLIDDDPVNLKVLTSLLKD